ncbi:MAG: 3-hydroxyacyl-ACP dehydratase FabZ [Armatimonadota bacterium]
MDVRSLMRILPHRYPFLLVDRVIEVEPGKRIVARKNVTANEPHFTGHFPDNPIMPGVLQLEMLAQAGGAMLLMLEKNQGRLALLAGIEKARFRRPVVPGDVLEIEVEVVQTRGDMGWVKGLARVDGKTVCEAQISFALADSPED